MIGEYAPDLPSVAGTYRLADYGAAYSQRFAPIVLTLKRILSGTIAPLKNGDAMQTLQIGAWIAAPLFKSGRLVAMFFVHSVQPRNGEAHEVESVRSSLVGAGNRLNVPGVTRALLASEETAGIFCRGGRVGHFLLSDASWD